MKKVLIAVDDTRASQSILSAFHDFVHQPVHAVLLYVERLQGPTMIIDMLGEPEMSTLKQMIAGTEHQEVLDRKADRILSFYEKGLQLRPPSVLKKIRRAGIPSDEILKTVEEEGIELIVLGESGTRGVGRFITGTVAGYVRKKAKVPVLVARKTPAEEAFTQNDAPAAVYITTAVIIGLLVLTIVLQSGLLP